MSSTAGHDQPAIEGIGRKAGDQHEKQRRQELRQSDQAEIERIAGDVIDLPAHRHRHDLHREARRPHRQKIEDEGPVMQGV